MMTLEIDYVVIGEVMRSHGVKGDVLVRSLTDVRGRYESLLGVFVRDRSGARRWFEVESVRPAGEAYLVKLSGIDGPEVARRDLVGNALELERDVIAAGAAETDEGGEVYFYELIGLEVFRTDGPRVGRLESIIETGANDVYVVRGDTGNEVLIPATHEVIETVDVRGGRLVVRPIAGLFDPDPGTPSLESTS